MKEYREALSVMYKGMAITLAVTIFILLSIILTGCKDLEMIHIEPMGKYNKYDFYSNKENSYYSKRDSIGAYELGDKIKKEDL